MSQNSSPRSSETFKARRQEALSHIQVGQKYTYRRTFTSGDVAVFCGLTGDFNPFHQDDVFSADSPFGRRIVPGLLTGSMLTHIGGLLGFLAADMHFEFLAPVFIGQTLTCVVTVLEKDEQRARLRCQAITTNQEGQEVLRATFNGFPTLLRLQPDGAAL